MKIGVLGGYKMKPQLDLQSKLKMHNLTCEIISPNIDLEDFSGNKYIFDLLAEQFKDCDYLIGMNWGAYLMYYTALKTEKDCMLVSAPLHTKSLADTRYGKVAPKDLDKRLLNVHLVIGGGDKITKVDEVRMWIKEDILGELTSTLYNAETYIFSETSFFDALVNWLKSKHYYNKLNKIEEPSSSKSESSDDNKGDTPVIAISKSQDEEKQLQETKGEQPPAA
jgi:hypothetical protein